jgi:hypothetical protein
VRKPHTGEDEHGLDSLLYCLLGVETDRLHDDAGPGQCMRGLLVTDRLCDQQLGVFALLRTLR